MVTVPCPKDKEINPLTGRCIKKCNRNQFRDPITQRCKKKETKKNKPTKSKSTPKKMKKTLTCPKGKEISDFTGKCVAKCRPGTIRNPATGRCRQPEEQRQRRQRSKAGDSLKQVLKDFIEAANKKKGDSKRKKTSVPAPLKMKTKSKSKTKVSIQKEIEKEVQKRLKELQPNEQKTAIEEIFKRLGLRIDQPVQQQVQDQVAAAVKQQQQAQNIPQIIQGPQHQIVPVGPVGPLGPVGLGHVGLPFQQQQFLFNLQKKLDDIESAQKKLRSKKKKSISPIKLKPTPKVSPKVKIADLPIKVKKSGHSPPPDNSRALVLHSQTKANVLQRARRQQLRIKNAADQDTILEEGLHLLPKETVTEIQEPSPLDHLDVDGLIPQQADMNSPTTQQRRKENLKSQRNANKQVIDKILALEDPKKIIEELTKYSRKTVTELCNKNSTLKDICQRNQKNICKGIIKKRYPGTVVPPNTNICEWLVNHEQELEKQLKKKTSRIPSPSTSASSASGSSHSHSSNQKKPIILLPMAPEPIKEEPKEEPKAKPKTPRGSPKGTPKGSPKGSPKPKIAELPEEKPKTSKQEGTVTDRPIIKPRNRNSSKNPIPQSTDQNNIGMEYHVEDTGKVASPSNKKRKEDNEEAKEPEKPKNIPICVIKGTCSSAPQNLTNEESKKLSKLIKDYNKSPNEEDDRELLTAIIEAKPEDRTGLYTMIRSQGGRSLDLLNEYEKLVKNDIKGKATTENLINKILEKVPPKPKKTTRDIVMKEQPPKSTIQQTKEQIKTRSGLSQRGRRIVGQIIKAGKRNPSSVIQEGVELDEYEEIKKIDQEVVKDWSDLIKKDPQEAIRELSQLSSDQIKTVLEITSASPNGTIITQFIEQNKDQINKIKKNIEEGQLIEMTDHVLPPIQRKQADARIKELLEATNRKNAVKLFKDYLSGQAIYFEDAIKDPQVQQRVIDEAKLLIKESQDMIELINNNTKIDDKKYKEIMINETKQWIKHLNTIIIKLNNNTYAPDFGLIIYEAERNIEDIKNEFGGSASVKSTTATKNPTEKKRSSNSNSSSSGVFTDKPLPFPEFYGIFTDKELPGTERYHGHTPPQSEITADIQKKKMKNIKSEAVARKEAIQDIVNLIRKDPEQAKIFLGSFPLRHLVNLADSNEEIAAFSNKHKKEICQLIIKRVYKIDIPIKNPCTWLIGHEHIIGLQLSSPEVTDQVMKDEIKKKSSGKKASIKQYLPPETQKIILKSPKTRISPQRATIIKNKEYKMSTVINRLQNIETVIAENKTAFKDEQEANKKEKEQEEKKRLSEERKIVNKLTNVIESIPNKIIEIQQQQSQIIKKESPKLVDLIKENLPAIVEQGVSKTVANAMKNNLEETKKIQDLVHKGNAGILNYIEDFLKENKGKVDEKTVAEMKKILKDQQSEIKDGQQAIQEGIIQLNEKYSQLQQRKSSSSSSGAKRERKGILDLLSWLQNTLKDLKNEQKQLAEGQSTMRKFIEDAPGKTDQKMIEYFQTTEQKLIDNGTKQQQLYEGIKGLTDNLAETKMTIRNLESNVKENQHQQLQLVRNDITETKVTLKNLETAIKTNQSQQHELIEGFKWLKGVWNQQQEQKRLNAQQKEEQKRLNVESQANIMNVLEGIRNDFGALPTITASINQFQQKVDQYLIEYNRKLDATAAKQETFFGNINQGLIEFQGTQRQLIEYNIQENQKEQVKLIEDGTQKMIALIEEGKRGDGKQFDERLNAIQGIIMNMMGLQAKALEDMYLPAINMIQDTNLSVANDTRNNLLTIQNSIAAVASTNNANYLAITQGLQQVFSEEFKRIQGSQAINEKAITEILLKGVNDILSQQFKLIDDNNKEIIKMIQHTANETKMIQQAQQTVQQVQQTVQQSTPTRRSGSKSGSRSGSSSSSWMMSSDSSAPFEEEGALPGMAFQGEGDAMQLDQDLSGELEQRRRQKNMKSRKETEAGLKKQLLSLVKKDPNQAYNILSTLQWPTVKQLCADPKIKSICKGRLVELSKAVLDRYFPEDAPSIAPGQASEWLDKKMTTTRKIQRQETNQQIKQRRERGLQTVILESIRDSESLKNDPNKIIRKLARYKDLNKIKELCTDPTIAPFCAGRQQEICKNIIDKYYTGMFTGGDACGWLEQEQARSQTKKETKRTTKRTKTTRRGSVTPTTTQQAVNTEFQQYQKKVDDWSKTVDFRTAPLKVFETLPLTQVLRLSEMYPDLATRLKDDTQAAELSRLILQNVYKIPPSQIPEGKKDTIRTLLTLEQLPIPQYLSIEYTNPT